MTETGVIHHIGLTGTYVSSLINVDGNDPLAALAALMADTHLLDELYRKWKFSKQEFLTMKFVIENFEADLDDVSVKKMLTNRKINNDHVASLLRAVGVGHLEHIVRTWTPPEFPVNGNDIMATGVKSGPDVGKALYTLYMAWEESEYVLSKEELLKLLE